MRQSVILPSVWRVTGKNAAVFSRAANEQKNENALFERLLVAGTVHPDNLSSTFQFNCRIRDHCGRFMKVMAIFTLLVLSDEIVYGQGHYIVNEKGWCCSAVLVWACVCSVNG